MTDDQTIEQAVDTAMAAPQNVLRSMFRAVYAYLDTNDPERLTAFAEATAASVRVHATSDYEKSVMETPVLPGPPGRTIEEIFAAHAPRSA